MSLGSPSSTRCRGHVGSSCSCGSCRGSIQQPPYHRLRCSEPSGQRARPSPLPRAPGRSGIPMLPNHCSPCECQCGRGHNTLSGCQPLSERPAISGTVFRTSLAPCFSAHHASVVVGSCDISLPTQHNKMYGDHTIAKRWKASKMRICKALLLVGSLYLKVVVLPKFLFLRSLFFKNRMCYVLQGHSSPPKH